MNNPWVELLECDSFVRVDISPNTSLIGQIKTDGGPYSILANRVNIEESIIPFLRPIPLTRCLLKRTRFVGDYLRYKCGSISLEGITKIGEFGFNMYAGRCLITSEPIKYFHELQTIIYRFIDDGRYNFNWCNIKDIFPNYITIQI